MQLPAQIGTGHGFSFHPVVRFTSREREGVTFVADEAMGSWYVVGQKVEVFYDRTSPKHAQIETRSGRWGQVVYIAILGAVLFGFGVAGLLPERAPKTQSPATQREPSRDRSRLRRISSWAPGLGVVALIVGLVWDRAQGEREIGAMRGTCTRDAECPSTFCDRGLCGRAFP